MKIDVRELSIRFGGRELAFRLRRNHRRFLKIVVSPDLRVDVTAPREATEDQIFQALHKKAHWIAQKLDQQAAYHPLPGARQYISGETLLYLGRQYRLRVIPGTRQAARLSGAFLEVAVKEASDRRSVKYFVDAWYRKRAQQTMDRYLKKCRAIVSRHGVPEPKLMIRTMQRRWGSCSQAGRITLNLKLIQTPVHCIEYVIMHELCHLKHHNHSRAFYALLTRCQPDWQKRKADLDRFRLA